MKRMTDAAQAAPKESAGALASAAHWGLFTALARDGEVAAVTPWAGDQAPSPLLGNIPGSVRHRSRVARPAVRRGWLERGPGPTDRRGRDDFVEPGWDEVLDVLAAEYTRVIREHGNAAIYGGSYGWASAGRFHHAQSQLHRFLNCLGGYTRSVNSYSTGCSEVFLPHVVAPESVVTAFATTWDVIAEHTDVLLCFGGIPLKNTGTDSGGTADHPVPAAVDQARRRGVRIVSVSPLRDDLRDAAPADAPWLRAATQQLADPAGRGDGAAEAGWISIRPGTDAAFLLALIGELDALGAVDHGFLARWCVGGPELLAAVRGEIDGQPKTAAWAAQICGIDPLVVLECARLLAAARRTLVTVGWSLQRIQHGEQPLWAALALAACLGHIGLPGGGFGSGYGSMNKSGLSPAVCRLPSLPQGTNPVAEFIPVALVSDMLLHPGQEYDYNGHTRRYPRIRLMHWAGGNPFHHHQDLLRLRRALGRLDTLVVADPYWTPMARHADIVLAATTALERDDLSGTRAGARLSAMRTVVPRHGQARDDYDSLTGLARRLGVAQRFTQGRDAAAWIEHLYETWRADLTAGRTLPPGPVTAADLDQVLPGFAGFWAAGHVDLPRQGPLTLLEAFRTDPAGAPLPTPSRRIELFSDAIKGFGYADCPPQPTWLEPQEWLGGPRAGRYPLHLLANQPRTRLHSQLDQGATSQASKVAGREPIRLHPADAAARGVADGDVVLVSNDRGACLAGVVLSQELRPGVVQLSTGAWYDPYDPARHGPQAGEHGLPEGACVHGNPNVLTADRGTSALAQGCTGAHVLVQVSRWQGPLPPVLAFEPPTAIANATHIEGVARQAHKISLVSSYCRQSCEAPSASDDRQ
ncbi:molybdopterin-dependent oxidoreductase [Kineosphaera limosa]|nr:molybdopterin-dependent oxidoreductase [Kineosphaera limosa]